MIYNLIYNIRINMNTTQIRATEQLVNNLKLLKEVRGRKESMSVIMEDLVKQEFNKYGFTQDGLATVGDTIHLAGEDRELTGELSEIVEILDEKVYFKNKLVLPRSGRVMFFSKIFERGYGLTKL